VAVAGFAELGALTLDDAAAVQRDEARAATIQQRFTLFTPIRALRDAALAVGGAVGIADASGPLPENYDPVDEDGNHLLTAVRTQPPGDVHCAAFALATAMEAWLCREAGQVGGVQRLSADDLFTGGRDIFSTADRAKSTGVVDTTYPGPPAPRDPDLWRLEWQGFGNRADSTRVEPMCRALMSDGPLVISIPLYTNYNGYTDGGKPYLADGTVFAYHAMCVYGFNTAKQVWLVQNSDDQWGNGGRGMIEWNDRSLHPQHLVLGVTRVAHPVSS
jgi:hypothetical protein